MVSLKSATVFCLVCSTFFVSARCEKANCETVLERLDNMESLCQGTPRNGFYFVDVLNGLNLSCSVIVNIQIASSIKCTCDFYDQVPILITVMRQMSVQQLRV